MTEARAKLDPETIERWRANPCDFVETALANPEVGTAYKLLPAERAFIERAFELGEDGRLRYPEMVYSCPKKSGKTAFAGMIALTITLLFGGRFAETIIVANDLEQAQGRVFEAIRKIVECSSWLKRQAKITQDRITFPSIGATIKAIAADFAGAAGSNPTITIFDELWGYTSERSRRLWDEAVVSPTRKISARLTVSYAGFEGESELLEEIYKRGMALPEVGKDLRAGDGMLFFWSHSPIAPWQTEAWLAEMRRSLRPNQYLRMIENWWVTTESSFIDLKWWDNCVNPSARMIAADRSTSVYVGIDASVKHDSTAIVAVAWDRDLHKAKLVWHRVFQPSPDEPLDFEWAIERSVLELHERFNVMRVWFDPYQMQASAQRLRGAGVPIEEFAQSVPNLTAASQNLFELIKSANLIVYPDDAMRLAISRAVAIESSRGWRIAKEKQAYKIDFVIALGMACLCAAQKGSVEQPSYRWGSWDFDMAGPRRLSRLQQEARNWSAPCTFSAAQLASTMPTDEFVRRWQQQAAQKMREGG